MTLAVNLQFLKPHLRNILFFRVTEINRFLLDYEYNNGISEATQVVRHVPNYDFNFLGTRMHEVWPEILKKI